MSARDSSIPDTMQGVVCHGPHDYRMETLPVPVCGPDDILVRVRGCGICASDVKCYHGAPLFWGDDTRPAYCQAPVTPGHEFIGEVVAMGERAAASTSLKIGDQAISEQIVPCWECYYCKKGLYNLCEPHDIYGFHQCTQGGMAEYMKFPTGSIVHQVPHAIPACDAVVIEPLSCAIHGVERGNIRFGDTVVIAGCGPIGLGMVAAAKLKGPERIVAIDLNDQRLDVARRCGADVVLNPSREDVVAAVKKLTRVGCDVYIEATGHPSAVQQGLSMIRKAGTFVAFSVFKDPATVDWTIIGDTKELQINGSHLSGSNGYRQAIHMLRSGAFNAADIVTHQLPLSEFQEGIDLVSNAGKSIKVALMP